MSQEFYNDGSHICVAFRDLMSDQHKKRPLYLQGPFLSSRRRGACDQLREEPTISCARSTTRFAISMYSWR